MNGSVRARDEAASAFEIAVLLEVVEAGGVDDRAVANATGLNYQQGANTVLRMSSCDSLSGWQWVRVL
jgi:hypothetical protein